MFTPCTHEVSAMCLLSPCGGRPAGRHSSEKKMRCWRGGASRQELAAPDGSEHVFAKGEVGISLAARLDGGSPSAEGVPKQYRYQRNQRELVPA